MLLLGDFNLRIDDATDCAANKLFNITECFNFKLHVSDANHTGGHAQDLAYTLELDIDFTHCEDDQ